MTLMIINVPAEHNGSANYPIRRRPPPLCFSRRRLSDAADSKWAVSEGVVFLISTLFLKWLDLFPPDQRNRWEELGDNRGVSPLGASACTAVELTPASGGILIC